MISRAFLPVIPRPSVICKVASARDPALLRPVRPRPLLFGSTSRLYASRSTVDEVIEGIQDQYATARDEFEIAAEETEKVSIYAEDDRKAAREELDKLHDMFQKASLDSSIGEQVKSRVGHRIRELDNAVKNMEHLAQNQD